MSKIVSGSFIIETLRFQCQTHSLNVLTKVIRAMEVMSESENRSLVAISLFN